MIGCTLVRRNQVQSLHAIEAREAKLSALRDMLNGSIARGGAYSAADMRRHLDAVAAELR